MTRFEMIMSNLRYGPMKQPSGFDRDHWFPVREFISIFNSHNVKVVRPGTYLCIDESMCSWRGREAQYSGYAGLPHVTKIPRKPEGVGLELKTLACSATGMLIQMEIMEGKIENAKKQFNQFGMGTGQTLRLTQPYFGTWRIVTGDSAFSSLQTLIQLKARRLFYGGIVKTAQREFP